MNAELLLQVQALDPAPADAELPTGMASADVVLAAIDERNRTVQTKERVDVKRPEPQRRWAPALVAAAAFVAVLAIGIVIWLIGTRDDDVVQSTTTTTTTTALEETSATRPLTTQFGSLEQGMYRVAAPFTLTVDVSTFFVQANDFGLFVLSPPSSRGPEDRGMSFIRLTALSDPAAPNASLADQGGGWPANDFGGWLDNLTDGVIVSDRQDTTLAGFDAIRVDLELGDIECSSATSYCVLLDQNPGNQQSLVPGAKYRIWVVEPEAADPVAVVLSITRESDRAWWDAFEKVLSTVAFEDSNAG